MFVLWNWTHFVLYSALKLLNISMHKTETVLTIEDVWEDDLGCRGSERGWDRQLQLTSAVVLKWCITGIQKKCCQWHLQFIINSWKHSWSSDKILLSSQCQGEHAGMFSLHREQTDLLTTRSGSVSCQSAVIPSSCSALISWKPLVSLHLSPPFNADPNSEPARIRGPGSVPVRPPEPKSISSITAVTRNCWTSFNVQPCTMWNTFQVCPSWNSASLIEEFGDLSLSLKCNISN